MVSWEQRASIRVENLSRGLGTGLFGKLFDENLWMAEMYG